MKMRSKKLRLFAVVLSLVTLFCSIPGVSAYAVERELTVDELIEAQKQAVEANEILMQYFFADGWVLEYPDYFGGCYIDDNILHVTLVEPTTEEYKTLDTILSDYKNVIVFEYRSYSQASLQDYADSTAAELKKQGIEVTHWYVEVETGNIIIGVVSNDIDSADKKVAEIKSRSFRSSTPQIVIEEGEYTSPASDPVIGGSKIQIETSSRSAGTCGYYDGSSAMVTCGHGRTATGSAVKLNSSQIGTVVDVQYTNGQAGDYSIIELTREDLLSHKIGDSSDGLITITSGTYLSPAVGTYVTKYGYKTGYSYGTVTATNVSLRPATDMTITGMTRVSITSGDGSEGGDSGGPYLAGNAFCGVHHGHLTSDKTTVFFTPYSLILQGGFTAIGNHDCTRWTDTSPSTHSSYCSVCDEIIYEAHAEHWNDFYGKCIRCGRTDPIAVEMSQ